MLPHLGNFKIFKHFALHLCEEPHAGSRVQEPRVREPRAGPTGLPSGGYTAEPNKLHSRLSWRCHHLCEKIGWGVYGHATNRFFLQGLSVPTAQPRRSRRPALAVPSPDLPRPRRSSRMAPAARRSCRIGSGGAAVPSPGPAVLSLGHGGPVARPRQSCPPARTGLPGGLLYGFLHPPPRGRTLTQTEPNIRTYFSVATLGNITGFFAQKFSGPSKP